MASSEAPPAPAAANSASFSAADTVKNSAFPSIQGRETSTRSCGLPSRAKPDACRQKSADKDEAKKTARGHRWQEAAGAGSGGGGLICEIYILQPRAVYPEELVVREVPVRYGELISRVVRSPRHQLERSLDWVKPMPAETVYTGQNSVHKITGRL